MSIEGRLAKVIAVTNQKGGVGKTTTAVNVAFELGRSGQRVLLIDFDPQGNATSSVGVDKARLKQTVLEVLDGSADLADVVVSTGLAGLDLAPSLASLADAEPGMAEMPLAERFVVLRRALQQIQGRYDYVLIDSPPSLSLLTVNALVAARFVLLPVQAEFFAMEGLTQLLKTIKLVRSNGLNPTLDIVGVVATMVGKNTLAVQVIEQVKEFFPGKVFKTVIPRNVRVAEAPSHGVPVAVYDKNSKGARAYAKLTKEIKERTANG